ncbi:hypothetical protein HPB52_006235 [Rhipicephalus sanguineus]|uniref:Uncharacterized protein n=1 Tax=Rhipicephalus sanguineus TaxID=34632 RepID=A0A9D4PR27_RHISA|nr:hypothetical protein HPB52_006235 [Rhipicephalus sanguineus]
METTFSHRMEKIEAAINDLYDMHAQSSPTPHGAGEQPTIGSFDSYNASTWRILVIDRIPEEQTGLYNTVQEIIEAQRSNQLLRLSRTPTGRNLLRTLRLEPSGTMRNEEAWSPIPIKVAAHMQLKPLPRNMNPQRHPGRRKARADYYIRWYRNRDDVLYVDAAVGPLEGTATAAAMTEDGRINISASIKTARHDVAEGVALVLAVAHAAADSTITEICTDSQSAYRYFRQGIAPNTVSRILRNIPSLPHPVTITTTHPNP